MIFYDGNLLKNVVFQHGNDRKFKKRVTISLQKCDLISYDMVLKNVTQFPGNMTQLLKIFSKFMIGKLYDKNVLWILIGDQVSQKCDMFSRNRVTFSKTISGKRVTISRNISGLKFQILLKWWFLQYALELISVKKIKTTGSCLISYLNKCAGSLTLV